MTPTQKAITDQYRAAIKEFQEKLEVLEEALCLCSTFNRMIMKPIIVQLRHTGISPEEAFKIVQDLQTEESIDTANHIAKHILEIG